MPKTEMKLSGWVKVLIEARIALENGDRVEADAIVRKYVEMREEGAAS